MSSNQIDEIYNELIRFYVKKYPLDSPDTIRQLIEVDIERLIDEGKTEEEAIFHLYRKGAEDETAKQIIETDSAPKPQIEKLRRKIDRLTVLFSKDEISEETYLRAVKKIEKDLNRLLIEEKIPEAEKQQPEAPATIFRPAIQETREAGEETPLLRSPSALWLFVPFFFGIIGGIVAYVGVKDDDEDMAFGLLMFGIVWSVILFIIAYAVFLRFI